MMGNRPWIAALQRHQERTAGRVESWYSITNKASAPRVAEAYIYDVIGDYGVTAGAFAQEINDLDVDTLNLKINSPGGEVFDGVAIYNAIKNHPATVNVTVDGLAASAASFIAMAGDTVHMARGAELMIHNAHGMCIGESRDLRSLADQLDRIGDKIAGFYAERTGSDVGQWRTAMQAETWYTGQEAVAALLADTTDDPPTGVKPAARAHNLSVFADIFLRKCRADAHARVGERGPEVSPFDQFLSDLTKGGHQ